MPNQPESTSTTYYNEGMNNYRRIFVSLDNELEGQAYWYDSKNAVQAFKKAIAASKNNKERAQAHYMLGCVHEFQDGFYKDESYSNFKKAVQNYCEAITLNPEKTTEKTSYLSNIFESQGKTFVFEEIKKIEDKNKRVAILKTCLDDTTALGKGFWKQQGVKKCSLEKGTLEQIVTYLKGEGVQFASYTKDTKKSQSHSFSVSGLFKKKPKPSNENNTFKDKTFNMAL